MSEVSEAPERRADRTGRSHIGGVDVPVERWLYPDESYQREFPRFVRAAGGKAIEADTVWCSEDETAVALWLPPGVTPDDEAIVDFLTATVEWSNTRICARRSSK